ncbi:Ig-like domain-containing protein [Tahibacter harae]|uniref:Ig-like domain-containing protein n=1 Tax=Tahibacter harae TaxID=2963937 RepID=A0ABT1QWQ8_9GAMM|nr:Ig-like domain-containing protein [Tahibacter harae]MCQ4166691.1 Ig-like domain-containing protein [Tahibacter harae]
MKLRALAGCIALVFSSAAALAAPAIVVTARSGASGAPVRLADGVVDRARHALSVDAQGNTYVAASQRVAGNWRYLTSKYLPDGSLAWAAAQAPAANPGELPYGVGTDAAGNVYVSGSNYIQFITLKYDRDGNQLWERRYQVSGGLYQQPRALKVDAAGNIYVAGRSQTGGIGFDHFDYGLVKYDSNGNELWSARYNGPAGLNEEFQDMAVDAAGNVYLTGSSRDSASRSDYATVKFDAAGVQQWAARYGSGSLDQANGIVVNGDSIVVTGTSKVGTFYDAVTVAYDAASGAQQWVAQTINPNHNSGTAIVRDSAGNLYVGGSVWDPDNRFLVVKYSSGGQRLWQRGYQPYAGISGSNVVRSLALHPDGGVIAAGSAIGFGGFDYGVVKFDAAGNQQWSQLFNGPPGTLNDQAGSVRVRDDGIAVVAGTEAFTQGSGDTDRATTLFIAEGVQQTSPQISTTPSVTGQPYQVQVAVRGKVGRPAGAVQLSSSDGQNCSITLVDGNGSCEFGNTQAGPVSLAAAFTSAAPGLFADTSGSASHSVDKAQTQLSLSAPAWSHPGDSISVAATLSVTAPGAGTPGGSIQVGDDVDSCTIAPPAVSCSLVLSTPGPRTLGASYAGDANFLPAGASAAHRVNRAPVAADDSYALAEDGSLAVAAAAGVLGNDSDADGDALQVVPAAFEAGGIGGQVVLRADGGFDYTPPADAYGTASFGYSAGDGVDSSSGTAHITVRAVNDAPSFSLGSSPSHPAGSSGAQSVAGFLGQFSPGPANEAEQTLLALPLTVESDPNDIVDAVTLGLDGRLGYVLSGRGGSAAIRVAAQDSGGTDDGGNDTSAAQTFTLSVASGVDLAVVISSDDTFLRNGSTSTHRVRVSNSGPDPALQAALSVQQPANLSGFAWTCTRSDAQPCAVASGSGPIAQNVDVPLDVTLHYAITATVVAVPEMPVMLNASVLGGAGQTELQPGTNSATHSIAVGIFAAGFER